MSRVFLVGALAWWLCGDRALFAADNICFTDEAVEVSCPPGVSEVEYETALLSADGLVHSGTHSARPSRGFFEIRPLREGIHVVRVKGGETTRFLAIAPPPALSPGQLRSALPRKGSRLAAGAPFVIGAYGDSVTATGQYPEILVRLLERSLGRPGTIRLVRKAHPGCSLDATLRSWDEDIQADPPDLALVMYGLNDQGSGVYLETYLDEYAWLARRLQDECGADVVFLQPTPHIDVFSRVENGRAVQNDPSYSFRAIGFASALEDLAASLSIPCAGTFQAMWEERGDSLLACAGRMRALFPPDHTRQMESMIETAGPGDTIHPNILGHLAIARAVFTAISSPPPRPRRLSAASRWRDGRLQTTVSSETPFASGGRARVTIYTLPARRIAAEKEFEAGAKDRTIRFEWPGMAAPRDLLQPAMRDVAAGRARLAVVTTSGRTTRVEAVAAPLDPPVHFERRRFDGVKDSLAVRLSTHPPRTISIALPSDSESGMIPLLRQAGAAWAAANVRYVRYARAGSGEGAVDGRLDEWQPAHWTTLGTPDQARWTSGPEDHRASPDECLLQFAVKAGRAGFHLAIKGRANFSRDSFTLFFDPREPAELGTPGRYYWVNGAFGDSGQISVQNGETSRAAAPSRAARFAENGETAVEIFVPYGAFGMDSWPASGDLGFAFWWRHSGPDGKITHLQWSATGHPWHPTEFGVVRKTSDPAPLPFMARVQ